MTELILNPTSTAQWFALVNESEQSTGRHLEEDTESYLVFMLMRHTGHEQLTAQLVGQDFLEGLNQPGHRRQQSLRDVGDHCLLFSGLFPLQAERRRVSLKYFVDLGRTAYQEIAEGCQYARSGLDEIFLHLSRDFVSLMDVLQGMRVIGDDRLCLDALTAYDLWQDTGSLAASKAFNAATGEAPVAYTGYNPETHRH